MARGLVYLVAIVDWFAPRVLSPAGNTSRPERFIGDAKRASKQVKTGTFFTGAATAS
jgi:hypothetical protein